MNCIVDALRPRPVGNAQRSRPVRSARAIGCFKVKECTANHGHGDMDMDLDLEMTWAKHGTA